MYVFSGNECVKMDSQSNAHIAAVKCERGNTNEAFTGQLLCYALLCDTPNGLLLLPTSNRLPPGLIFRVPACISMQVNRHCMQSIWSEFARECDGS
jgi:hypothetical protein